MHAFGPACTLVPESSVSDAQMQCTPKSAAPQPDRLHHTPCARCLFFPPSLFYHICQNLTDSSFRISGCFLFNVHPWHYHLVWYVRNLKILVKGNDLRLPSSLILPSLLSVPIQYIIHATTKVKVTLLKSTFLNLFKERQSSHLLVNVPDTLQQLG